MLDKSCLKSFSNEYNDYILKEQIAVLLKDLVRRYTKWGSSGLKIEKAEYLLNSLLYAIDFYYIKNNIKSNTLQKNINLKYIYEEGLKYLEDYYKETNELYNKVLKFLLDVPNLMYNTTLRKSLKEFFSMYNLVFGAHDTICDIDYILLNEIEDKEGILFINEYLKRIDYENKFCRLFDIEDIKDVLKKYCFIYKSDYKNTPFNMAEVILNNAIFYCFLNNEIGIIFNKIDKEKLIQRINVLQDKYDTDEFLSKIFDCFIYKINFLGDKNIQYLKNYKEKFIALSRNRILNSIEMLIISESIKFNLENKIIVNKGLKLNDSVFRYIVERINQCKDINTKIKIIKDNIKSFDDFIDVLKSECLYDDEYFELFRSLTYKELAFIVTEFFIIDKENFKLSNLLKYNFSNSYVWKKQIINYIKELEFNEYIEIEDCINSFV